MRKTVRVLLCMVWLMLCAALPAFGAESAPHVTAETTMAQLGRAKSVKVQKENTVIVDGAGAKDAIAARIGQIRSQIEETTSELDK